MSNKDVMERVIARKKLTSARYGIADGASKVKNGTRTHKGSGETLGTSFSQSKLKDR